MSSTEEEVNLEEMTKSELQDHADELGVDWSEGDTKAELIDAINAADGEATAADESEADAPTGPVTSYASESNPERRPVEVDLANVDPGDGEGEHMAPLNAESWVVLDGSYEGVPDDLDGAVAAVVTWPVSTEHDTATGETLEYTSPEGLFTVKERGQGILLSLPADAFKEIHTHGRPATYA